MIFFPSNYNTKFNIIFKKLSTFFNPFQHQHIKVFIDFNALPYTVIIVVVITTKQCCARRHNTRQCSSWRLNLVFRTTVFFILAFSHFLYPFVSLYSRGLIFSSLKLACLPATWMTFLIYDMQCNTWAREDPETIRSNKISNRRLV